MTFRPFLGPSSSLTFHNVKNDGNLKMKETSIEKEENKKQKNKRWDKQHSPCFCENVAGRRPATFSQKHGLCPFRVLRFRV